MATLQERLIALTKRIAEEINKVRNELTYTAVTSTSNGLMTTEQYTKLDGIAEGAEVNQNAFSNIVVGDNTLVADSTTDTLTLISGEGIKLSANPTLDKLTIEESYVDACIVTSLTSVPSNLRNGGIIILKS